MSSRSQWNHSLQTVKNKYKKETIITDKILKTTIKTKTIITKNKKNYNQN